MITLDACLSGISSAAIAGHIRPDGDSVGSCLAVYNYILAADPQIRVDVYLEPIPEKFSFLKNADRIRDPKEADPDAVYDVFFCLDCGDAERLGEAYPLFQSARRTVCIDHHATNQSFADLNEVEPQASSTAEMIFRRMDEARIDEAIAACLYLGIAHDTGVFRYSNTSRETMEIAGFLMGKGIPYSKILDETYYIRSYVQQRIWGKALRDAQLVLDGKCIVSVITKEDQETFGASPEDLDGIVSELRSTEGVEVAVFLYELDDGYKISLRSTSYVDVAQIASEFGGGGHARAAGAEGGSDPEKIREQLLARIAEQI